MDRYAHEPLLKWAGGKRRLLGDIVPLVPSQFGRYYEPFFGGGALFFALSPAQATLSDTNPDLINAYVQVRDNLDSVLKHLRTMENSKSAYYRVRDSKPRIPATQAAKLIYLCALSFNGIYRQNLRGKFNVPYGYKTNASPIDEPRLRQTSSALQGIEILSADFEETVSTAGIGDLVYFDPPYTVAHGNNGFLKYNAKIFSWDDQRRLAATALRLKKSGCRVLVSNADHPSIHDLYKGFKVRLIERHSIMSASSEFRRRVRECLFH